MSLRKEEKIFLISKISKESCLKSSLMQKYISEFSGEMRFNIDGMINAFICSCTFKTIAAFHLNFFKFKQALAFKRVHRKTKIDSILKKCKSKFFRIVQEATKALLEDYYSVPTLPQSFVTNINIDVNKSNLGKSLRHLYEMFDDGFHYDAMLEKVPLDKLAVVDKLMSMSYHQLYDGYINSKRFVEDCEGIKDKEGEKFEILYRYVAKIYIKYYSISKGNKTKKKLLLLQQQQELQHKFQFQQGQDSTDKEITGIEKKDNIANSSN